MTDKNLARVQGLLREGVYLAGLAACVILGGLVVWGSGVPPFMAWLGVLILPLAAVVALAYVATRFVAIVYRLPKRDAFNYWTVSVFGPLSLFNPFVRDYAFLIVENGQVDKKSRNTALCDLGGPGVLVVFNDSAAVLEYDGRLTRVVGPCVKFLRHFEQVRETFDLRPQVRQVPAKVMTKDGILLEVDVQATFQLSMDPDQPVSDQSPYRPLLSEVHKAALVQTNFNRVRTMNWADRINGNLDSTLRGIVSDYTFDELFKSPDDVPAVLRQKILDRLQGGLEGLAPNFGGRLLDVRLGTLRVIPEALNRRVQEQRVDSWRAVREGEVEFERARGEARVLELHTRAELAVRQQMIKDIVECMRPFMKDPAAPNWLVALRLVEMFDKMQSSPESVIFIPRETADTIKGLRSALTPAEDR